MGDTGLAHPRRATPAGDFFIPLFPMATRQVFEFRPGGDALIRACEEAEPGDPVFGIAADAMEDTTDFLRSLVFAFRWAMKFQKKPFYLTSDAVWCWIPEGWDSEDITCEIERLLWVAMGNPPCDLYKCGGFVNAMLELAKGLVALKILLGVECPPVQVNSAVTAAHYDPATAEKYRAALVEIRGMTGDPAIIRTINEAVLPGGVS